MEIILIAAMAANRVIGRNKKIPWELPGEQKRFKEITMGHPLIMGRRTHESIGGPLPGRRNIVVTRNKNYQSSGCAIVHSLDEAYSLCSNEERVFNIGGEQLYRQGLESADTLMLTVLKEFHSGDAYFPEFSLDTFGLVSKKEIQGPVPYTIKTYRRKKPWNWFF